MKSSCCFLLVLLSVLHCSCLKEDEEKTFKNKTIELPSREAKVSLLETSNVACYGQYGNIFLDGFCDTWATCTINKGRVVGFCHGKLKCCLITATCGQIISTKSGYFVNIDNVAPGNLASGTCTVSVRNFDKRYTQIRLDFINLELAPPSIAAGSIGDCIDEYFTVENGDQQFKVPHICGSNTGQHMYINFPVLKSELRLVVMRTNPAIASTWTIGVTQILGSSKDKAPEGCLQYFPCASCNVKSFNFYGGQHLNNQDYEVCFEALAGLGTTFRYTEAVIGSSFIITGDTVNVPPSPLPITGEMCLAGDGDYVMILRGMYLSTGNVNTARNLYCGYGLPSLTGVTTNYYRMLVYFNSIEYVAGNVGFNLNVVRT